MSVDALHIEPKVADKRTSEIKCHTVEKYLTNTAGIFLNFKLEFV
jgi:hypothetical protein